MSRNISTALNGIVISLALGGMFAAFLFHSQYGRAHGQATKSIQQANEVGGTRHGTKLDIITSPEVYYRRAQSATHWTIGAWALAVVVGLITRKWVPCVVVTVIVVITVMATDARY